MPKKNLKTKVVLPQNITPDTQPEPKKKRKSASKKSASSPKAKKSQATSPSPNSKPPITPTVSSKSDVKVRIDYPADGEIIGRAHYAIRISCSSYVAGGVEISIDDSEYIPAREAVGYWWFDWCDIPEGAHTLIARAKEEDGSIVSKSKLVKVAAR